MTYRLSLLDKSPIPAGQTATQALRKHCASHAAPKNWGITVSGFAEHHHTSELAISAPEVVIAFILANTSHIRVGSGGVMLQHYSPYKVAEVFNVLSSLAPGRWILALARPQEVCRWQHLHCRRIREKGKSPISRLFLRLLPHSFPARFPLVRILRACQPLPFRRLRQNVFCSVQARQVPRSRPGLVGLTFMRAI